MSDITADFRKWMDDRRLRASDVAKPLHVTEQAIHNWRSAGVPPRREPVLREFMANWRDPSEDPEQAKALEALKSGEQNLVLMPTPEQFDAWTAAYKASPFATLHEWAVAGLEEMAREAQIAPLLPFQKGGPGLRVAELTEIPLTAGERKTATAWVDLRGGIAAGEPFSTHVQQEPIPVDRAWPDDHYALKVFGASMEPKVPDGSTIIVKAWPQELTPRKGMIVVYSDATGSTLKEFGYRRAKAGEDADSMGNVPVLRSLNQAFKDVQTMEGGRIDAVLVEVL